jgi:hypothetical protein
MPNDDEEHKICARCEDNFKSHGCAMFTPCTVSGCSCPEFIMPIIPDYGGVTTD